MASQHLINYLNNHLAGSVTAIELLAYLSTSYSGTPVAKFAVDLRNEIIADQKELEALMLRLEIGQSKPRKAAAWVGEKFAQLKLRLDDLSDGSLRLLEATEAVSIGIEGKRLLWCGLESLATIAPELRVLDYPRLIDRAVQQRVKAEQVRLNAAREALIEKP